MKIGMKRFFLVAVLGVVALSVSAEAAVDISFTINMNEAVAVTGAPRVAVDVGGATRYATYSAGSGTTTLTFTLSPQAGDVDLDGIAVSSPIDLNGGTIKDLAGNNLAVLTFTPPNTSGIKVNYPSLGMDFTYDADGRYTLNGTTYNDLPSFLTAAGGTFSRASIGTYYDSAGILQTAASSAPRFDYDPVTYAAKGILIEEARTNLFLHSDQFNSADWSHGAASTITANAGTAPDGTNSAFLLSANNAFSSISVTTPISVSASTSYTYSAFLKAGNYTTATLVIEGANNVYGTYNFSGAGSALPSGTGYTNRSASITAIGNGWYRCTLSFTVPASGVVSVQPKIWIGQYDAANHSGMNIYIYGGHS